jgi:hypothetical protein
MEESHRLGLPLRSVAERMISSPTDA